MTTHINSWEREDALEGVVIPKQKDPAMGLHGKLVPSRGRPRISDKHYEHGTYVSITGKETKEQRYEKLALMASEYTTQALMIRKSFIMEYTTCFNATKAALRSGAAKTVSVAGVRGSKIMAEAYCQLLLAIYLDEISEESLVTRNMVLSGLLKEANNFDEESSHSARVGAWSKLGKYIGMDIDRSLAVTLSAKTPQPISEEAQEEFLGKFLGKY